MEQDEKLINLETSVAHMEKTIDELNEVVIEQGKKIEALIKYQKKVIEMLTSSSVKPLSEETPPPHY